MNSCYACKVVERIDSPLTDEHIIPQLLGGRLKAQILCKQHNSILGSKLDIALLEAFQPFRVFLGLIEGSSKKPKRWEALKVKLSSTKEEFLLNSIGDAFLSTPKVDFHNDIPGQINVSINASTEDEMNLLVEQMKNRFAHAKKVEFDHVTRTKDENAHFSASIIVNTDEIRKAIAKIAVGFAFYHGVNINNLADIIKYCFNQVEGKYVSHLSDFLTDRLQSNGFNHSIVLSGSKESKLLVCFLELFGCAPFLILLNDDYDGPDINQSYTLEPTRKLDETIKARVVLSREDFEKIFIVDDHVPNGFADCFEKGMQKALQWQKLSREISDVTDRGIIDLGLNSKSLSYNDFERLNEYLFINYFEKKIKRNKR